MSSNCEASEATGDSQSSSQPSTERHVGVKTEDEAGAAGMEGAVPSPTTHGAAASPGSAHEPLTVGAADHQVATGDASSCQGPANSDQNHQENLSREDNGEPSLNDSGAVALGSPSLSTPQSVNEVTRNEDMPGSSASSDDVFSSDKCSEVVNKSSQEDDVTGSSSLSLEHPSKSQGIEKCGSDREEESGGQQEIGKLLPDEKNSAVKDSADVEQNEKATASGEGATGVRAKPEFVPTSSTDSDDEKQSIYQVKWIKHKGTTMPIITQNENGPCPLLAIMNLLLLQSKIKLPSGAEVVTSNELMAYLADWIFEHVPKNISEDTRLNYEQNMHDAIAVFPRLQTGLDVNVRFTGVSQFEYTPECIVFDLLDIPLYHGWLVDPQMPDLVSAIGNRTYNQLVEKIIVQKNSNKEELIAEALLAEEFLNVTASQLTYHGLSELSATTREDEMCVLFRNNHFSTFYKHKNELFVLVTDQGFLRESNVVWETLSNIEGDGHFVDSDFRTYRLPETAATTSSLPSPSFPINSKEQIDHDYLVALSLEQEQSELQPGATWSASATLSDHELALRLQEEENMSAESVSSKQQQPAPRQQKPEAQATTVSNLSATGSTSSNSCVPGKEKKESSCLLM